MTSMYSGRRAELSRVNVGGAALAMHHVVSDLTKLELRIYQ